MLLTALGLIMNIYENDCFIQEWTQWQPKGVIVPRKCYSDNLHDENKKLFFILGSADRTDEWHSNSATKGRAVKVTFDKSIVSYQYIEEGYTMYILAMLSKKYGEDFLDWSLFTIKHSPYFDYISSLSKIPLDPEKYTHYVFFCVDELFEVIADHEPTFELID